MENKKNSITQTQILNDINKIIDQSLNTITNKIEEENNYDNKQIKEFNLNLEKVEKNLSNAFVNLEKTIKNEDFNKKNISKINQKKEEDLINICSEIFDDKINNLKNMIPNEINNFNKKIIKFNNDLISSFNIIKETIKNNLNIKKNNNNKINNNYNNNININDTNNNYNNNNGININNVNNNYNNNNNNQNRGYDSINNKNDKNQIKLDGVIISPKNKFSVNSLDIKDRKFDITLDIKNNGKIPLNKDCFIEGESENLFIQKYYLSKQIMNDETLKVKINVKYKDMNANKINSLQKINIILYDNHKNQLDSIDIQVEIRKIQEMKEQNEIDNFYQGNKEKNQNERSFQRNFERLKIKFPKIKRNVLMNCLEAAEGDFEQAVEFVNLSYA